MKKIYSHKGTLWVQRELNYSDDLRAKEIFKSYSEYFVNAETKFGEIIDKLFEDGIIPKLFGIILRPHQPTVFHRFWNGFWAWRNKIDLENPIMAMPNSLIGRVLVDFFVINTSWMRSLANSRNGSPWNPLKLMEMLLSSQRKFSSGSPAETPKQ